MSLDFRGDGAKHTVVHDPWDKADLKRARAEVRALGRARKKLGEFGASAGDALDDVFFVLHKADPRLVDRAAMDVSHVVNHQAIVELVAATAVRRLREHTVGDLSLAAAATVELAKTLEAIFDRLSLAREYADKLTFTVMAMARAEEQLEDATDALDKARALDAQAAVALFKEIAQDLAATLESALSGAAPDLMTAWSDGVGAAADRVAESAQVNRAWGASPGALQKMPVEERLKLAKTLNTPRLREIADLFGRIHNLSLSVSTDEVDDLHDEVVDLEFGSDLGRVAASEFLLLADPLTEPHFLARLADSELVQYQVQGVDEVGRGGIVMCIDGSGSMAIGQRDVFAKATMLALLHQARAQGRQMHVIHFGYRQVLHFPFVGPDDFTAERIIAAAKAFWASGTDFETPMAKAVEVLHGEFEATGKTSADVVFATDDECWVPETSMREYLAQMRELKARTWGLMVEGEARQGGALWQMSEGRVLTVKDLTSGTDLRPMLAGL